MRISVVVSTYDQPRHLERVLWGYAVQSDREFELVLADDGSGEETARVVEAVSRESGLPILHVRHADRGFRKPEILNRAILASAGEYLIFTDGDCIPRRDLVAVHRRFAAPDRYLAGGYLKLPERVSEAISVEDVRAGRATELGWLRSRGWRPGRRALRMLGTGAIPAALDLLTPTATHFHGNNASTWRELLLAVNGFEQEMGWGGLDRALGYRLENLGVRGKQLRHRAVCVHLHHDRPYRREETVRRNREILDRIRRDGEVRARRGIEELEPDREVRVRRTPLSQEQP